MLLRPISDSTTRSRHEDDTKTRRASQLASHHHHYTKAAINTQEQGVAAVAVAAGPNYVRANERDHAGPGDARAHRARRLCSGEYARLEPRLEHVELAEMQYVYAVDAEAVEHVVHVEIEHATAHRARPWCDEHDPRCEWAQLTPWLRPSIRRTRAMSAPRVLASTSVCPR
eukprot:scaffold4387_cov126-Isochrysis_galbana.AAC.7